MRVNSSKQTQASRRNGGKSNGPKSKAGKAKSAQNSTQDGIFSRKVVIEQLGETQAQYDETRELLRQVLQPANALEEMLFNDYLENWWRRERIRRAERVELESHLAYLDMKSDWQRTDKVEALRSRFFVVLGMYSRAFKAGSLEAIGEITGELEKVRQQLTSTTLGIDFLLGNAKYLIGRAKTKGVLSDEDELLLKACFGFGSAETETCLRLNLIGKRDSKKWAKSSDQPGPPKGENAVDERAKTQEEEPSTSKAEFSTVLAATIEPGQDKLRVRRFTLAFMEAAEDRSAWSLASLDPGGSERFSRAESAVERRMYRALAALSAMKAQGTSYLLPEPKSKKLE